MESLLALANAQRTPAPGGQARDSVPSAPPALGDLVLGRYRLLECLGAGGFGVVWRAHDELLHREVAVKRIPLAPGEDGERASREALAAARLAHPAIVALYEACAEEDAFYLISELVAGSTLAQLIADGGLSDEEVLEIGVALSCALSHAHARGVIHRDIKPHNVLVPDQPHERAQTQEGLLGAAKLTDFGGASLAGEDALTRTGDVIGTLAYMAPEQSEGREVEEEADLYALALVLYEALSGVNPVRGGTPAATARRIGRTLPSLERRRRDLPRELTRALDRALLPSPRRRGTVDELRLTLEQTLQQGLRPARRRLWHRDPPEWQPDPPRAVAPPVASSSRERHSVPPDHTAAQDAPGEASVSEASASSPRLALPRRVWWACALAAIVWQAAMGRPGVALLLLAGATPLLLLPADRRSPGAGPGWLAGALAPVLGLAGLAGAFPAVAGQATSWRKRVALAALGYWWLTLAEAILAQRLWLGPPPGAPARIVWESSLSSAADHIVGPMLGLSVLFGATVWALGAMVLPWIVRGRNAALDVLAATIWSAALVSAATSLNRGLPAHAIHPGPRGAVLGAVLGGVLAVGARALRGPV